MKNEHLLKKLMVYKSMGLSPYFKNLIVKSKKPKVVNEQHGIWWYVEPHLTKNRLADKGDQRLFIGKVPQEMLIHPTKEGEVTVMFMNGIHNKNCEIDYNRIMIRTITTELYEKILDRCYCLIDGIDTYDYLKPTSEYKIDNE